VAADVDLTMQEIRNALAQEVVCTANLKGLANVNLSNPVGTKIPQIQYYDSAGIPYDPPRIIATADAQIGRMMKVDDLRILPISSIGGEDLAAEVQVTFGPSGEHRIVGPQTFVRHVYLLVKAPAGNVTSCLGSSDANPSDKICQLISNGKDIYDPTQDKCIKNVYYKWRGQNLPSSASCLVGEEISLGPAESVCKAVPPAWFSDNPDEYYRTYSDGSRQAAPPVTFRLDRSEGKCTCIYELGLNPSGWKCMTLCLTPKDEGT
jgi:hypothetical protein